MPAWTSGARVIKPYHILRRYCAVPGTRRARDLTARAWPAGQVSSPERLVRRPERIETAWAVDVSHATTL
ncbi:MAG TPA: hypothetical protein VMG58_10610 [Candidatus Sulfotelmatobacter sp.]|nr:hypothetical protein [Candidatus Sulfotelmatobacter sp.]